MIALSFPIFPFFLESDVLLFLSYAHIQSISKPVGFTLNMCPKPRHLSPPPPLSFGPALLEWLPVLPVSTLLPLLKFSLNKVVGSHPLMVSRLRVKFIMHIP